MVTRWANAYQPVVSCDEHRATTVTLIDSAVTIVEYYCCSVECVSECLLIDCVVVLDHFVVVVIVAYSVVRSFAVIAWTYFVVIFVNFVDCCDG